eukprot:CAMPEP_0206467092 /NCGR_PEP_ID=MMETSP0324_2-20121206/28844_1 /ASSEMBLY_ACC=CAM_ASM_000836 /TAXON_ID=2866 /ORGANISM="Crypthecodinium cohnii, Strain Seligo" /LENGTH=545 /DNA_ID=CAMNT_0053940325 /DNA_START=107 /DNA_END=1744 /DNA_ORIENTATION=+
MPLVQRRSSLDEMKLEKLAKETAQLRQQPDYYKGCSEVGAGGLDRSKRYVQREQLTPDASGLVVALVGLPARGKSFISRKLERFLGWRGLPTKTFNVGKYRRDAVCPEQSGRSEFFDPGNSSALAAREAAASAALDDALLYLERGGKVSILDATNSSMSRRKMIVDQVNSFHMKVAVIFLEALCEDPEVLEANMLSKVKGSPDFWQLSLYDALQDLKARIAKYESVYETVQDSEGPHIKVFDLSSKVLASQCYGRLTKTMLPFLTAIHIGARPIWLVRAGFGEINPESHVESCRLAESTHSGREFAEQLDKFVRERSSRYWHNGSKSEEPPSVLTSTMPRAILSVQTIEHEQTPTLNPIDKGTMAGGWWDMDGNNDLPPWQEMERLYPAFYKEWTIDPFRTRFPGGESYLDVSKRLESVLLEVESFTRPVLIVSHITVLQLLLSYFLGTPVEDSWKMPVPKDTVLEVSPTCGGSFVVQEHQLICGADQHWGSSSCSSTTSGASSEEEPVCSTSSSGSSGSGEKRVGGNVDLSQEKKKRRKASASA